MCYLCEKYGDGGIWYLNPANYARNMYKLRAPGEGFKDASAQVEGIGRVGPGIQDLMAAIERGDFDELERLKKKMDDVMQDGSEQDAQVLPLRDCEKMLEFSSTLGLMACACRRVNRGIIESNIHEYTCLGMGVGLFKWERWPERYKGGVKFVTVEEAVEWNREMDRRGFVHLLMLFGAPYIGGLCQCDYPDCNRIRAAVDFGVSLVKSHYIAQPDYSKCNGCGVCAQRCQFGALKIEVTSGKANIDQFKCYGCGLCETGCPRGAIRLVDRKSLPAVAEVWR